MSNAVPLIIAIMMERLHWNEINPEVFVAFVLHTYNLFETKKKNRNNYLDYVDFFFTT